MPKLPRGLLRLNRESLIPRDELGEALACNDHDKVRQLGKMLTSVDPRWRSLTIGGLAHRCGVGYSQLMQAYTDYKKAEAVVTMARELPAVAQDIADDAKNKKLTCQACEGTGSISAKVDADDSVVVKKCIPCNGSGSITQRGDKDARKQMLEVLEMAGRGATNIDARGGNVAVLQGGGSLEEELKKARSGRQSRAEVTDGRTIDMDSGVGQHNGEGAI
jgi:hypothetical protein